MRSLSIASDETSLENDLLKKRACLGEIMQKKKERGRAKCANNAPKKLFWACFSFRWLRSQVFSLQEKQRWLLVPERLYLTSLASSSIMISDWVTCPVLKKNPHRLDWSGLGQLATMGRVSLAEFFRAEHRAKGKSQGHYIKEERCQTEKNSRSLF